MVRRVIEACVVTAVVLIVSARASAQRPPALLWSADDNVSSRQISLAISDRYVMLSEAYGVTILDRTAGTTSLVRIEEYIPVQSSPFADGRLWLGLGLGEGASQAPARISVVEPGSGRLSEVTRTHAAPCSLRVVGGELYWVDQTGGHVHHARPGGPTRTLAPPPRRHHYAPHCGAPLAIDDDAVYLLAASDVGGYRTDLLVRVPRDGTALEVLATGLPRSTLLREVPGGLVVAQGPGPAMHGSIARLDLATRASTVLVADLPRYLDAIDVQDGALIWAEGNYFSEDDWAIHRVPLVGGAIAVVHHGDRRLFGALAIDATGTFALVSAHPPGECHSEYRGCGQRGETIEVCSGPDHQLLFLPTAGR